jgi:hypothetical protein
MSNLVKDNIINDQNGDVKPLNYGELMGHGLMHIFILFILLPLILIHYIFVIYDHSKKNDK